MQGDLEMRRGVQRGYIRRLLALRRLFSMSLIEELIRMERLYFSFLELSHFILYLTIRTKLFHFLFS
jgi:hypothetical protein